MILHDDKKFLHKILRYIQEYTSIRLNIKVKDNWQVFPVNKRGIDFLGYVFYHDHIQLRKSIKKKFCKVLTRLYKNKKLEADEIKQRICSWWGWAKYCDSRNLMKHILVHKMRANTVLIAPSTFESRGDNTYYYNYNIVEGVKENEDGTFIPSFDYDQVIIFGNPSYSKVVSAIVRDRYTIDKELALLNNYHRYILDNTKTAYNEEYLSYSNYVADVKNNVKQSCLINAVEIDS